MRISALNVVPAKVLSLKKGPVSTLVVLEIAPGVRLTSDAARSLQSCWR